MSDRHFQGQQASTCSGDYPWRCALLWLLRGLDAERECSASPSTECWLIERLTHWNRALYPLGLVLRELEPGKLCLASNCKSGENFLTNDKKNDASFIMAWLPRQHKCIEAVQVLDLDHVERFAHVASFVDGPDPEMQRLVVWPRHTTMTECLIVDAFGPPQHLRELEVCNVHIKNSLAATVAEVLRANAVTLATVKLTDNLVYLEAAKTLLLGLVGCVRLKELSFEDSLGSSSCEVLTEVLESTRGIQKVTLVGITRAKTNCRHAPSEGHASRSTACLHCLTRLFAALEDKSDFRHFTLEFSTVGNTLGEALENFLTKQPYLETVDLKSCRIDDAGARHLAGALATNCSVELLSLQYSPVRRGVLKKVCSAAKRNKVLKKLLLPQVFVSSLDAG